MARRADFVQVAGVAGSVLNNLEVADVLSRVIEHFGGYATAPDFIACAECDFEGLRADMVLASAGRSALALRELANLGVLSRAAHSEAARMSAQLH